MTLLSPLLGLLLVEGAVRALALEPAPLPRSDGILFRLSRNRTLAFENRPGAVRRTEYLDNTTSAPRVVEQRVNALGFRGPEVARTKPRGTHRIACLGDSHTFGAGVAGTETWPAHLQRILDREFGHGRVEVMNCGVSAYDTHREVVFLRERVLAFEPDLVLLQYHVNDVHGRDVFGLKRPADDPLLRWSHPRRGGWIGRLRSASRLAELSLDRLYRYRGVRVEAGLSLVGYAESSPGWIEVRESLTSARDLLAGEGIDFAVVLFPFLLRHGEQLSSHEAFERVSAFCREAGIPCLDAERAFLPLDVEELRVHAHDYHADGRAHRIFAEAVYDWLSENGPGSLVSRLR